MNTHVMSHHRAIPVISGQRWLRRAVRFVLDRFLLLPAGAIVALIWANTLGESYFTFAHRAAFAANEIGMALFLGLVVQEAYEAMMPGGALHSWRRLGTPWLAAAGGVAGSAAVYLLYVNLKYELVLSPAWPAATAVDVAAAYFVARLIWRGRRALAFVLMLALATDAFGVLFIAVRQGALSADPVGVMLMATALASAAVLRTAGAASWIVLVISGTLSWMSLYLIGLHPALALLPIVPFLRRQPRGSALFAETRHPSSDAAAEEVHQFERGWNEAVQVVLFMFGLVNAGILLQGHGTGTWAMLTASLVGRPLGILAALSLAPLFGLTPFSHGGWRDRLVLALATSAGFTFPLFLATGILPPGPILAEVKMGALVSVVVAFVAVATARLLHVGRSTRSER